MMEPRPNNVLQRTFGHRGRTLRAVTLCARAGAELTPCLAAEQVR